jgi:hypothetical protein
MRPDRSPCAGSLLDDHHSPDRQRSPTTLSSEQLGHQPELAVERREQLLYVKQPRLDLDDEHCPRSNVPTHDVNRSPFAVVAEGVLDERGPASRPQQGDHGLDKLRMAGIEQPSHFGGCHAGLQLHANTDALGYRSSGTQRQAAEPSRFDPRHCRLIDSAGGLHIHLAPTLLETRRPNQAPDSAIIHAPMIHTAHYHPLTHA